MHRLIWYENSRDWLSSGAALPSSIELRTCIAQPPHSMTPSWGLTHEDYHSNNGSECADDGQLPVSSPSGCPIIAHSLKLLLPPAVHSLRGLSLERQLHLGNGYDNGCQGKATRCCYRGRMIEVQRSTSTAAPHGASPPQPESRNSPGRNTRAIPWS